MRNTWYAFALGSKWYIKKKGLKISLKPQNILQLTFDSCQSDNVINLKVIMAM